LGLASLGEELVASQQTQTRMMSSVTSSSSSLQHERLEILVPETAGEGPIGKFLEKKGSGIHHLALSVDPIEAAIAHLVAHGVRMIDSVPRPGAHATHIAFVHPESTGGLLVELVQERA
jgi:methylmalonyl-CoA/ethylmalonyl-CoA epimerase